MQKLSKLYFLFFLLFLFSIYHLSFCIPPAAAQVPELRYPCDGDGLTPEFHSLRPYQAAHCGDANKARYCSNDLIFIEKFDVTGMDDGSGVPCKSQGTDGTFTCNPGLTVREHDLIVDLDDSMFPIMGNTEQVKNSQNSGDEFDDATKVNEYASWYLSGVNNRAEYGENTDDNVVNYSGPVNKLLPKLIQELERMSTINKATDMKSYTDEDTGEVVNSPDNHNQIVVCERGGKPVECPNGSELRLKDWSEGSLSIINTFFNWLGTDIWNYKYPPLPWQFKEQILYKKAYNEWQGKSCAILPIIGLQCIDTLTPNKWADLYQYIPLSSTTDKKGAQLLAPEHPIYRASAGTAIELGNPANGQPENSPLYFAHTQEVKELSELLNKTYTPTECTVDEDGNKKCELLKNEPVSKTTEQNYCSVVNVRVNQGDDLFPGEPHGIIIPDVTYKITEAQCKEQYKLVTEKNHAPKWVCGGTDTTKTCLVPQSGIKCTAEVYITIHTQTKTPNADEIFSTTVADSGSTFRKIFPKVDGNAPVTCIADIPTVTDVTYTGTNFLEGGDSEFKVKKIPEDGAGENPQLTFPHVGSIYEYFLKGIQTALRPKGYGEPITSGTNCLLMECGKLPDLPKGSGSCALGDISSRIGDIPQSLKDIVEAAAETYKVPPNLILAQMFGEGLFNKPTSGGGTGEEGGVQWSDYNVKNWATCSKIPNCNDGAGNDGFIGFFDGTWKNIAKEIKPDLLALDPNRIQEPSRCNLLDAVYGLAWNLHDSADGSPLFPEGAKCIGIPLNRGTNVAPNSCDWKDHQYNSAIRISEFGTGWGDTAAGFYTCATKANSCFTGGSEKAQCETDTATNFDTCDYKDNSHNQCVYDVAHGN